MLKSFLKGIILFLFSAASLSLLYFVYYFNFVPRTVCENPVQYSIGNVAGEFGISQDNLLKTVKEAENMWEYTTGLNLFDYNPESDFNINLVFDERQQQAIEAKFLEEKLDVLRSEQDNLASEYEKVKESYEEKLQEYNAIIDDFEKKVENYNKEVEKWNEKGGAPKDVYENLKDEENELNRMAVEIENTRKELNILAQKNNIMIQEENEIVAEYNLELMTYRKKFGEERHFDQGDYDGKRINIYQFNELIDLRLILAHELGHALGIEHLENPKAVMHYLMGEQDLDSGFVTSDDSNALKAVCNLE